MRTAAVLLASLLGVGISPAQEAPRRHALLIGIDQYARAPLYGAVNDTRLVANLLRTRFGFAAHEIRMLHNREATRQRILGALRQLVSAARPGDLVWIHYSGHGSKVKDLNNDEPDGIDETLVPVDRGRGGADIVDDELDAILGKFKTDRVVLVLDSCHSGSGSRRGGRVVRRNEPPDKDTKLYRANPILANRIADVGRPRITFSATLPTEEALDAPMDGRSNGLFTRAFVQALSSLPRDASPRAVLEATAQQMRRLIALVNRQPGEIHRPTTPTLEAPRARLDEPLLGSMRKQPAGARLPWVPVEVTADAVILRHGADLGGVGSQWALYPPDDLRLAPGRAVCGATVTAVRKRDAMLRLDGGAPPATRIAGHRAVLVAPAPPAGTVTVKLEGNRSEGEKLRRELGKQLPTLRFAGDDEPSDYLIKAEPGYNKLYGPARDLIVDRARSPGIAEVLSGAVITETLLSLDNRASALHLKARVANLPPTRERVLTRGGIRIVATGATDTRFRVQRSGEPITTENSLQLAVTPSADCYLTVVYVDAEGDVGLMFPVWRFRQAEGWDQIGADEYRDGRLVADQTTLLPDTITGTRAGFAWVFDEPGLLSVRLFATHRLADAERIRDAIRTLHEAQETGRADSDTAGKALLVLRQALIGVATRGFPVAKQKAKASAEPASAQAQQDPAGDWTAVTLTVKVER